MKLTIRKGMFETNSSSMHSIVVTDNTDNLMYLEEGKKYIWDDGTLYFYEGEMQFGRSPFNILADVYHKTAYAIASFCGEYNANKEDYKDFIDKLTEMFKNCYAEFDHFEFSTGEAYPYGCVDHQSDHLLKEFLENEHVSLEDFIFSPQYIVIIDGDECCVWDAVKSIAKSKIVKEVY